MTSHRQPSHYEKLTNWEINTRTDPTTLILGTSNLARIQTKPRRDIEIHSYAGGRFEHMANMLDKMQVNQGPTRVIIAMGINDSNSRATIAKITTYIHKTAKLAKAKFPFAKVWFAQINISSEAPPELAKRTKELNAIIADLNGCPPIPHLTPREVRLDPYDRCRPRVHWTNHTADVILRHWLNHLN